MYLRPRLCIIYEKALLMPSLLKSPVGSRSSLDIREVEERLAGRFLRASNPHYTMIHQKVGSRFEKLMKTHGY